MRIDCPHCGPRSIEEFTYRGDATVTRPDEAADGDAFFNYVYIRRNPRGAHLEHWQHTGGCRAWLTVERNTFTHEISGVWTALPGPNARPEGTTPPVSQPPPQATSASNGSASANGATNGGVQS